MAESLREDVLGCVERLRDALADPALDHFYQPAQAPDLEACRAACRLAVALGYCRLFGIRPPEDLDGTLPSTEATAAAGEICRQIEQSIDDARKLGSRWDAADPLEAESLCADLLEGRMDAWAGVVAIGEAYHACLVDREPEHEVLGEAFRRLVADIQAFDAVLQEEETLAILSTLVGTQLLNNWQALLVEPYVLSLPWWLDRTLEEVGRRIEAECLATIPGPNAWRRLRERMMPRRKTSARRWNEVLLSLPAPVGMAAKGPGETPDLAVAHWRSPDGRYLADLPCPPQPLEGQKLYLKVVRASDEGRAEDLQGELVRLAGVENYLDATGCAAFLLDDLLESFRDPHPDLSLVVGSQADVWEELPLEDFRDRAEGGPNERGV